MKTTLNILLAFLALPVLLNAQQVVKIGVIIPLSKEMAHNGEDARDAMSLRLEQIKQANDSLKYDYQLIFEDNQNSPRLTATALKKLIDIDHINALTSLFSGPGTTVAPIAQNKGLLHIGCCYNQDAAKGNLNFVHWSTPAPTADLMVAFCKKMGYKKVAAISQIQAGTKVLDEAFAQAAAQAGIDYTTIERVNPDLRDLRTSLKKIQQTNPDLLLLNLFDPQLDIALRQMRELGITTPISSMGCWGTSASELIDGYPFTDTTLPKAEFVEAFQQRYGRTPVNFACNMADMVDLIVYAHELYDADGLPSGEFLASQLAQLKNYPGIMGELTPNAEGFFDAPALLKVRKDGVDRIIELDDLPLQ